VDRIGILVELDFLKHHVGVRNYLLTLYQYLAQHADVRFLAVFRPHRHSVNWFRFLVYPGNAGRHGRAISHGDGLEPAG
jgi:hypothetical protein